MVCDRTHGWELVHEAKNGYRLMANRDGRLAIFALGSAPEAAPLWIDRTRDLFLDTASIGVPVLDAEGRASWVFVSIDDAGYFAREGWSADLSDDVRKIIRTWRALGRTEHRR